MVSPARTAGDLLVEPEISAAVAVLAENLKVALGSADAVRPALEALDGYLATDRPEIASFAADQLLGLLGQRQTTVAGLACELFARHIARFPRPLGVLGKLLEARSEELQRRAAALAPQLASLGWAGRDPQGVDEIAARCVELPAVLDHRPSVLALGQLLDGADGLVDALIEGSPQRRRLAAHVLDAGGLPDHELARRVLGREPADALRPYLEFTRATHLDLVTLTPRGRGTVPCLDSVLEAAGVLSEGDLAQLIGDLGWARVCWGMSVRRVAGIRIDAGIPYRIDRDLAVLLEDDVGARREWERTVVVLEGESGACRPPSSSDAVLRFRRYNLIHAELLDAILEVAPLSRSKAEFILRRMATVVDDFAGLFGNYTADGVAAQEKFQTLREHVEAALQGEPHTLQSGATARVVQMFEEPRSVDEVSTLHGLKRYLHQRGLRLAFRLFGAASANRTVDVVVTEADRSWRIVQSLRYVDFEPESGPLAPPPPLAVSLIVDAFAAHLLHGGSARLPSVEVLAYGNEVQIYLHYFNHPAFLRLDLSSPRDGGMLDLEFFGVSQTELDNHPDLELSAIRRLLTNLDFDVERDSLRLRIRYDKERALDLEDLIEHVRHLLSILPYLMDLDWIVAGLDYPATSREEVVDAWARHIARHAVLPVDLLLTGDRRHIWRADASTPTGTHPVPWDGRTPYADRFSGPETEPLATRLERVLAARGLDHLATWGEARGRLEGQRLLERVVLHPLRDAIARGELGVAANTLVVTTSELFRREHEAVRLARVLAEGGAPLARAAMSARLVRRLQRVLPFNPSGAVQGHPVERATVRVGQRRIGIFALRDGQGIVQLAVAAEGGVLYQHRPGPSDPWRASDDLDLEPLVGERGEGEPELGAAEPVDGDEVRRLLLAPRTSAVLRHASGNRIWPAVVAAPGRAGGFARFVSERMKTKDAADAVLVAPAFRPDHAPLIARAAALLSTGGGILSHAGVTALELGIPALAVEAVWSERPTPRLLRQQVRYCDEQLEVQGLSVTVLREVGETFDVIQEGDLVVVDADGGMLSVLGQDPDALAIFREIGTLESAAEAIDQAGRTPEMLAARGWLIRCVHQLEKLLARLTCPNVARYAASALAVPRTPRDRRVSGAIVGHAERSLLLATLLANPVCGQVARAELGRIDASMRLELERLAREALDDLPFATNVFQIVGPWLVLLRTQRALEGMNQLLDARRPVATRTIEQAMAGFRSRLRELQHELVAGIDRDLQSGEVWQLRHSLRALDLTATVSGAGGAGSETVDRARQRLAATEARHGTSSDHALCVLDDAGGTELAPAIGAKAANLGETARILGPGTVPRWAAITNCALQQTLAQSIGRAEALGAAIRRVLSVPDVPVGRKADEIQGLWSQVPLPADVRAAIVESYREICGDAPDAPIAVRSSAFEEDSERQQWAGQFATYLGVRGEDAVVDAVRAGWAALWSKPVLVRRQQLRLDPAVEVASGIVLQRMVDARASGVLFTASPAARAGQMVLNVGLGLGEGVVSGTSEVDLVLIRRPHHAEQALDLEYKVADKRHRVVLASGPQRTQVATVPYHQRLRPALEFVEIQQLVMVGLQLERVLRHPLDIEFAFEGPHLKILQARPVPVFHASLANPLLIQAARASSPEGEPS